MERNQIYIHNNLASQEPVRIILEWPDVQDFDQMPRIFSNAGTEEADRRAVDAVLRRWASLIISTGQDLEQKTASLVS